MANDHHSFYLSSPFNFDEIQGGNYVPISDHHQDEEPIFSVNKAKNDHLLGLEDHGDHDLSVDYHQYGNNFTGQKGQADHQFSKDQDQQQQRSIFDDFDTSSIFLPTQPTEEISTSSTFSTTHNIVEAIKQKPIQTPLSSLKLLSNNRNAFNKLKIENFITKLPQSSSYNKTYSLRQKLSTEDIVRIAGARYIQFSDQGNYHGYCTPLHPFGCALSGLSDGETKDVELVHILLAAAEKVGFQQFDRATRLLQNCEVIAASRSNPVERVVAVFAGALRERIERENGMFVEKNLAENDEITQGLSTNLATLRYHQQVPFLQVMQFPAIQAIVESFEPATKLHLIDLEIRSGIQWTGLMQALAAREERPIELLKITAIGVRGKQKIEETRKRLVSLAESLNLLFSFNAVIVSDMEDIKEELFEIDRNETVIVHSSLFLRTMLWRPHCLEKLMRVIRNLRPSMMVVAEVEADHNSPSFARRFIEVLFFYAAFFDCLETCINLEDFRTTMEEILAVGIKNMVATERSERIYRNVRINVWRAFFTRFGMVEIKLSDSSHYQASLVAKQFGCGNSCTLERNGKCLMVGWKGTAIHSFSAWKFL
ncbi:DELLA protein RGL1 [Morus notabilis]|uniref:DELLA protein RGL1 n=1 Tax=Morus notabilis TaxID=981085 RepID=UPI000CED511A|nr:DELLA protein RGL1 [Morus notabilis]